MILPECGSKPPQKLKGSSSTTASPTARPVRRARPSIVVPEGIVPPDPPLDCRPHTLLGAAEDNLHADVARSVVGPLCRVGHHGTRARAKDRRDVGACVDDDLDAGIPQLAGGPTALHLREHATAGGHVEVNVGMHSVSCKGGGQLVELCRGGMRGPEADCD